MSELQRPGPCPGCDGDGSKRCVGVSLPSKRTVRQFDCVQLRAMWDAGHAAGARSERAAQAIEIANIHARPEGYGFCPDCGTDSAPGTLMERRPNGNTKCGQCGLTRPSRRWLYTREA